MTRSSHRLRDLLVTALFALMFAVVMYLMIMPWWNDAYAEVDTIYGRRRSRGRASVNGTSVFAEMLSQRGCRVTTWHQLSPRLKRSDVIVWAPDSFELPSNDEIDYLEAEWLRAEKNGLRTLIYVARDFDAAILYWQAQMAKSEGGELLKARQRLAQAQSDHAYARALTGTKTTSKWFSLKSLQHFRRVEPSRGPWSADIDPQQAQVTVASILEFPSAEQSPQLRHEVLLGSEDTPLVVRLTNDIQWPDGQVIVLVNGFSVLNLPLVNHEHRKVAGKLIDACRNPARVTFLETGPGGPRISRQDPRAYSGFEALTVWPINSILLHLIIAGILFCLAVFPIFGRPRELADDTPSDFGKHIRAIGDLLALANDRQAALAHVQQYRHLNLDATSARQRATSSEPEAAAGNPFKVTTK